MRLPRPLNPRHPLATEWKAMIECLRSLTPRSGSGTTFTRTPFGTTINTDRASRSSSSQSDVVTCNPDTGEME